MLMENKIVRSETPYLIKNKEKCIIRPQNKDIMNNDVAESVRHGSKS